MDFNIVGHQKSIDMDLESILQLICKKLSLGKFSIVSKGNIQKYLKRLLKFFFSSFRFCKARFSLYMSNQKNIQQHTEYACDNPVACNEVRHLKDLQE